MVSQTGTCTSLIWHACLPQIYNAIIHFSDWLNFDALVDDMTWSYPSYALLLDAYVRTVHIDGLTPFPISDANLNWFDKVWRRKHGHCIVRTRRPQILTATEQICIIIKEPVSFISFVISTGFLLIDGLHALRFSSIPFLFPFVL